MRERKEISDREAEGRRREEINIAVVVVAVV